MKKALYLLLALLLLSKFNCQSEEEEDYDEGECKEKISSGCENLKVGKGYYKCCLFEAEFDQEYDGEKESKLCRPITQTEYDDIKDYIKKSEDDFKNGLGFGVDISIDCASNYVMISLLSLIILFL